MNRLRLTSDFSHVSLPQAIFIAVASVGLFSGIRLLYLSFLGTRVAFITCFPALMFAALFGGLRSGLLATLLSAVVASYCWMHPTGHLFIADPSDFFSLLIFLTIGSSISWVTDSMNRFRSRAAEAEAQVIILQVAANEQRRIGQELHDGTGQELTGLTLFSSTLVDLLNHGEVETNDGISTMSLEESQLSLVQDTAKKLLQGLIASNRNVQLLSRGIMPVEIEADGLPSALDDLATKIDDQQRIACRFDCPDQVDIANSTVATNLYRIAQEAVSNALRHSDAKNIQIELAKIDNEIVLEITDDGKGFDPAAVVITGMQQRSHGFGLGIMSFRAASIGGRLQIAREVGRGMLIRCTVPQTNIGIQ